MWTSWCCVDGQPGIRICGCYTYVSNHKCLEHMLLPIFKDFPVRKCVCSAQRLFTLKNPSVMIHSHYLRYGSTFSNIHERFFNENYQVINMLDNTLVFNILPN